MPVEGFPRGSDGGYPRPPDFQFRRNPVDSRAVWVQRLLQHRSEGTYATPPKGELIGHDFPENPKITVEECRRVTRREVEGTHQWSIQMLSTFPDGSLAKEMQPGGYIYKCDKCPVFDDDGIVYGGSTHHSLPITNHGS